MDSPTVIQGAAAAAAPGAVELCRGTLLGGRYEIGRLLGRGGMGLVMQASDHVLGEEVAVKVLRPEHGADDRWIDRLVREVKLARQIRHPNVCRVFDFGQSDGHAFLVMELAAAGSLRDELAARAAPPLAARLADARAVAAGLAAIHAGGIVHRDVTPQNVLRMADGRLAVSDFGLATDADPAVTSLHGGTVAYMAPEIARGHHAGFASDVWALGIILHEIVFGCRPSWQRGRFSSKLRTVNGGELGRAERRIAELCRRCTTEAEHLRPPAADVAREVEQVATPEHGARRRFDGRRHFRTGLALAAALAVAAIAAHVGRRAARQESDAATLGLAPAARMAAFDGRVEDWTQNARVLATVDGRIHAVAALPGGARAWLVWGEPRRAEEVDLATGARTPAALPALPQRPGPPAPSPSGAVLAVEGYTAAGHPFVFLAPNRPGAEPVPVSAAADPSLASEPRWLAGGHAFIYDADARNTGVFSLDSNRATILPPFESRPSFTTFKAAVHDRVLVAQITDDLMSQIAIFSWPGMQLVRRFDLPAFAVEWQSDGRRLFGLANEKGLGSIVFEMSPDLPRARRLGNVPGQALRALALVGRSLVFVSFRFGGDIWLDDPGGGHQITHDLQAREVARGGGRLLATVRRGGEQRIVELDERGHERGYLTPGPNDEAPSVLPGGQAWTYVHRIGAAPGYYRCVFGGGCTRLTELILPYATVSPDGARVAYVDPVPQGPRARLMALEGSAPRDLGDGGSYCAPVWSSGHTLWISRRTEGPPVWVEIDADSADARPTGRRHPGARDCTDGLPDPAAPVRDGAKIVVNWRSELRLHAVP